MTQPAFGRDLSCLQDEDAVQSEVNGYTALAQALARRLQTPRGTLIGDSAYGYHIIGEIDDDIGPADVARIATNIDAEFVKDQRVLSSFTSATFGAGVLVTQSTINTTAGPWKLTLAISDIIAVLGLGPQGGGVIAPVINQFTPLSRKASLLFWYEGSGLLQTGAVVTSWPDSSGNGNTLVPNAVGPVYNGSSSSYGNQPVSVWTAATLQQLIGTSVSAPQPNTIYIVCDIQNNGNALDGQTSRQIFGRTGGDLYSYAGSSLTSSVATPGPHAVALVMAGASSAMYVDTSSAAAVTGNAGAGALTGLFVGSSNGVAAPITGNIAEIVGYSGADSPAQISQMFAYLSTKYAGSWI